MSKHYKIIKSGAASILYDDSIFAEPDESLFDIKPDNNYHTNQQSRQNMSDQASDQTADGPSNRIHKHGPGDSGVSNGWRKQTDHAPTDKPPGGDQQHRHRISLQPQSQHRL